MASSVASNGSPTLRRTIDRSSHENPGFGDDAVDKLTTRMVSLHLLQFFPSFFLLIAISVSLKPPSNKI